MVLAGTGTDGPVLMKVMGSGVSLVDSKGGHGRALLQQIQYTFSFQELSK